MTARLVRMEYDAGGFLICVGEIQDKVSHIDLRVEHGRVVCVHMYVGNPESPLVVSFKSQVAADIALLCRRIAEGAPTSGEFRSGEFLVEGGSE